MYEAIGVKNIDQILPPPAPMAPMDPSMEHINALAGKPFQAFPGQDHRAHITAHLNFMSTNIVRNNPAIMAAIQKNILEHISLMAQEQVQLEFREVDLRAMENERKRDNDEAQVELARARLMQQRENFEDKLEQNEDLSKLRAGVSLAKSGIQQAQVMMEDD